jgi:hypothetical protein
MEFQPGCRLEQAALVRPTAASAPSAYQVSGDRVVWNG